MVLRAGDVNSSPVPATALTPEETAEAALRRDLAAEPGRFDEIELRFDDGSTFSAREALDMIDGDREIEDLIDLCAGRAG